MCAIIFIWYCRIIFRNTDCGSYNTVESTTMMCAAIWISIAKGVKNPINNLASIWLCIWNVLKYVGLKNWKTYDSNLISVWTTLLLDIITKHCVFVLFFVGSKLGKRALTLSTLSLGNWVCQRTLSLTEREYNLLSSACRNET